MYLDIFRSQIDGVPCLIGLTEYVAAIPARLYGPPERCEEGWPAEISFDVLKLNERMYPWLADQMTNEDYERICQEVEDRRERD